MRVIGSGGGGTGLIVARMGAGSAPVGVVSDDDPIAADLSVPVLLREVQAEVPCAVLIGGGVLPGSGGADHIVAGHSVRLLGMG